MKMRRKSFKRKGGKYRSRRVKRLPKYKGHRGGVRL